MRVGSTARIGTRLGEIINLEDLEVEVPVQAQDIRWIDKSKPVVFTSSEVQGIWKGHIKRIGKSIDDRTQTIQVFMTVDKNGEASLVNGIFLKAEIPGLAVTNAFSIDRHAIYKGDHVYLIKNGKLDFRPVDVARNETDLVIINGGLENGDTLVTELLQGVAPGMAAKSRSKSKSEGSSQ